jgi:cobalamin synthase
MLYPELFIWWVISISWSIVFLIVVSVYLYTKGRPKETSATKMNVTRLIKDFVFVWVLIGLLVFYIVSVNGGSSIFFAAGNIVVEVILIIYVARYRIRRTC